MRQQPRIRRDIVCKRALHPGDAAGEAIDFVSRRKPCHAGADFVDHAGQIHAEHGGQRMAGMLRLTCSDWFGRVVLAPVLAEFNRLHPGVIVETLTDQRVYSLSRREADLVIRITGFDEREMIARRLLTVPYAVYGQSGRWKPHAGDETPYPVVVMDTAFAAMPDIGWLMQTLPGARIAARSNSRDMQAQLCALGTGLAVLPRPLGDATPGIEALDIGAEPPTRDTWLGYHRDLRRLPRLRALVDLLIERLGLANRAASKN